MRPPAVVLSNQRGQHSKSRTKYFPRYPVGPAGFLAAARLEPRGRKATPRIGTNAHGRVVIRLFQFQGSSAGIAILSVRPATLFGCWNLVLGISPCHAASSDKPQSFRANDRPRNARLSRLPVPHADAPQRQRTARFAANHLEEAPKRFPPASTRGSSLARRDEQASDRLGPVRQRAATN